VRKVANLSDLNIKLERNVAACAVDLATAHRESEIFSYSVSHALQAPIRAIKGFSQAIMEDYGQLLPDDGRQDLESISEGGKEIGRLIEDLLTFSHLIQTRLRRRLINTRKLVESALAGLGRERKDRQIDIKIGDLPPCHGDAKLLKQVWMNLLSNALKYTRKREGVVIEIGCQRHSGENVYFVRDNGTGFDMRYAGKVFGVFQRLHSAEDYEGTGVGLAIAHRIVRRHGGRIWASARQGSGATFFFSVEETARALPLPEGRSSRKS